MNSVFLILLALSVQQRPQAPKNDPTGVWQSETGTKFDMKMTGNEIKVHLVEGSNRVYLKYDIDLKNAGETSLAIANKAYEIADYTCGMIEPGKTVKIVVSYQPQPNTTGAVLNVQTSPSALADPNFVLPLNVKLPFSTGAGYTKEELEEMLKRAR